MPTVEAPKQQPAMEAANPAQFQQQPGAQAIVATQPVRLLTFFFFFFLFHIPSPSREGKLSL